LRTIGPAILFCPGDRPDRFAKAAARADAVILDLEDAVAPENKPAARTAVLDALPLLDPARTTVRINSLDSPWGRQDADALRALAAPPLVMLPKAGAAIDLDALAPLAIIALCESAAGILAAPSIAHAANCVGLMWGSEDLIADLGGRAGRRLSVLAHAQASVLLAATAAGLPAIDTVLVDIDDTDRRPHDTGTAAPATVISPSGPGARHRRRPRPDRHRSCCARTATDQRPAGTPGPG
jgi:citrate lyase subunit beta/citryl-CoA lyase